MEKYTNQIINEIEESIVIVNKDGYIQSINKQTQELLEESKAKVIGKELNKVFNILNSDCILNNLSKAYSSSSIISDKCILDVNGFYKTISFHAEVIEQNDEMVGAIIFIRDITSLERAQEILKNSEARFRSLYNSMLSAYTLREIIYDDEGEPIDFRYVEVNPAFEKVSGKKREEVIGKTYTEGGEEGKICQLTNKKPALKAGSCWKAVESRTANRAAARLPLQLWTPGPPACPRSAPWRPEAPPRPFPRTRRYRRQRRIRRIWPSG